MMKSAALTLVATTLLAAGLAHADDAAADQGPKSPNTALMLSLGGTAASAALVIVQPDAMRSTRSRLPLGFRRALAWATRAPPFDCGFSHQQPNDRGPHPVNNLIGK